VGGWGLVPTVDTEVWLHRARRMGFLFGLIVDGPVLLKLGPSSFPRTLHKRCQICCGCKVSPFSPRWGKWIKRWKKRGRILTS
jgi:hypothetical protein